MSKKTDRAQELFRQGCNCSQSVLAAFCDATQLDIDTALRISAPFGAGVGRMREVCGAVSGMCMVLGLLYGSDIENDPEKKAAHYALIQRAAGMFEERNGSCICRTLLGLDAGKDSPVPQARTSEYYKKRPCVQYVCDAAQILETLIAQENEACKNNCKV